MRDEIIKGIGIGLVLVVLFVSVGSMIGSALSHGPEPHGEEAAAEAPADGEAAAEGAEAPAEGEAAPAE